ncbi:MAG TPA: LD-carboxypeptidase [Actinomycetes bacterium]|nr:LD-carboxypeptidase [Actinomycetes bacterium]
MSDLLAMPRDLRPGDHVAVVAPSGPVIEDRLSRGVEVLRAWGLQVEVMPHVLDTSSHRLFAGTDEDRARDIEDAWCRRDAAAVLCARGGYGASRCIDLMDWNRMQSMGPRWLVGSSDITALHEAVNGRLGLVSVYGPMVASEIFAGADPHMPSIDALHALLFGGYSGLCLTAAPKLEIVSGRAEGRLVGGNLALIASGIGTAFSRSAEGSIVFLEDVGEQPYRVDRMLTQLLRSGWFNGVQGVAVGTFYECGDVETILRERLVELKVPVVAGFLVGHGPVQHSLLLGARVVLDSDEGTLRAT